MIEIAKLPADYRRELFLNIDFIYFLNHHIVLILQIK